jgi:hypothetical protein
MSLHFLGSTVEVRKETSSVRSPYPKTHHRLTARRDSNMMKKRALRIVTRRTILSILLATFGGVVYASDADYFNELLACDESYFSTLGDCRYDPNYPNNPDESMCRFRSGDSYTNCINNIFSSMSYELDFCTNARAARNNCVNTYQLEGDYDAYLTCRSASGVDQCE